MARRNRYIPALCVALGFLVPTFVPRARAVTACDESGANVKVLYVNLAVSGTGNQGGSWDDAFNETDALQDALDAAPSYLSTYDLVEIWVAAGTYKPTKLTAPSDSRSATFRMLDKVHLYGGFTSACTGAPLFHCIDCTQRLLNKCVDGDPNDYVNYTNKPCAENSECGPNGTCSYSVNITILSGDLDGDDGSPCDDDSECGSGNYCPGGTSDNTDRGRCVKNDNAYHVVTYDLDDIAYDPEDMHKRATLDGFVVQYGRADGATNPDHQGGGIQVRDWQTTPVPKKCLDDGPILKRNLVRYNFSEHHGAINDHAANTTIDNCSLIGNRTSETGATGAGLNVHSGSPKVTGCLFIRNRATETASEGGAVWTGHDDNQDGSCGADGNVNSAPEFEGCVFLENYANGSDAIPHPSGGGGIWNADGTHATLTTCTFIANIAQSGWGGGLYDKNNTVSATGCKFIGNVAGSGAGVYENGNNSEFEACLFEENQTSGGVGYGGALSLNGVTSTLLRDTCFSHNSGRAGGAIWKMGSGSLRVINSDFVGNAAENTAGGAGGVAGGAIAMDGSENDDFFSCSFLGNHSDSWGGGFWSHSTPCLIANSVFSENTANGSGGAIAATGGSLVVVNCSIVGNTADADATGGETGGGLSTFLIGIASAMNCVFSENEPEDVAGPGATVSHSYADVEYSGDGNIWYSSHGAPDFMRLVRSDCDGNGFGSPPCETMNGTCPTGQGPHGCDDYGDLRLQAESPCIDAGDDNAVEGDVHDVDGDTNENESAPDFDIEERTRDAGGDACVDMGAYEFASSTTDCCITDGDCTSGVCCNSACCASGICCNGTCCSSGVCCAGTCQACCSSGDCGSGKVCCNGVCRTGNCCSNSNCTSGFKRCCVNFVCTWCVD